MFFLSLAFAGTWSAEVAISSLHPSAVRDFPASLASGMSRRLTQVNHVDTVVQSTDPRVSCRVENGWVSVDFLADAAHWPESFPVSASCTLEGNTLNVSVVKMSAATDLNLQSFVIQNDQITITKPVGSMFLKTYKLPEDSWVLGKYSSTIPGVRCVVLENPDAVQIQWSTSGGEGTGECLLPREGAEPYVLTLELGTATI